MQAILSADHTHTKRNFCRQRTRYPRGSEDAGFRARTERKQGSQGSQPFVALVGVSQGNKKRLTGE